MSSGQWEVVGKNKKSQNGKVKSKEETKKAVKNGPKLEDVGEFHRFQECSTILGHNRYLLSLHTYLLHKDTFTIFIQNF